MDDQYPENGRCIPMQASWQHDLVQVDEDGFVWNQTKQQASNYPNPLNQFFFLVKDIFAL